MGWVGVMGSFFVSWSGLAISLVLLASVGPFAAQAQPVEAATDQSVATNRNKTLIATRPNRDSDGWLASFRIKKGFRLEQVASDALVSAPVAMAFDENGRLFVAEMRDYPNKQQQVPHLGRIRLLEDTDGDGYFDASTVYAENLAWPSAIACYNGGLFVASTPDILYLKDVNGDGVSDTRKIIFSGFGVGSDPPTFQNLVGSFQWGIDNRIHGVAAGQDGAVSAMVVSGVDLVPLHNQDFSFDGRSLTLMAEAGSGQSGLAFDIFGRRFVTDYTRPLRLAVFESRYLQRNPFFAAPDPLTRVLSVAATIYLSNSDPSPKPSPGVSGSRTNAEAPIRSWFSQARGTVIYRGNAFPSSYLHNVFIADSEAHVIHRAVLRDTGLETVATRATDEAGMEFLSSSEPSFRPSQIINSPEGVLYVADIATGGDSGRILRIVPDNFKQSKTPQLGKAKTYDLAASLAQGNGWYQDTAARLLYERRDPAAAGLLSNMVFQSRLPLVRLRALHALDGQAGLTERLLVQAMRDSEEHVREHAILLSEKVITNGTMPDLVWSQLKTLAVDPSIRVRCQLALTLGEIRRPDKSVVLRELLSRSLGIPWMTPATFSAIGEGAGDFFIALANDPAWRFDPVRRQFLLELATMIGAQGRLEEVTQVLNFIDRAPFENAQIHLLLHALGEGLLRTGSSLALIDPQARLRRFYDQTEELILNEHAPDAPRIAALKLRSVSPYTRSGTGDFLQLLLGSGQSVAIQTAAIATLARYDNPDIPETLFSRWRDLSPALRNAVVTAFMGRSDRLPALLAAVESGRIQTENFSTAQIILLRTFPDPAISQRAVRLFGPFVARRPEVVDSFKISLKLPGSSLRGRATFNSRCATCHGVGLGPHPPNYHLDFTPKEKQRLLQAIIEPHANLRPGAAAQVVLTKTGQIWAGRARNENKQTVTLQQFSGTEVVLPRANIASMNPQPWSIMPEGLEKGLSPQDMADLLEYIISGTTLPSENPQAPSGNAQ